jgi:hypothetical protein
LISWHRLLNSNHEIAPPGDFSKLKDLQTSGIPNEILKSDVPCISGDFDGDGISDLALVPLVESPSVGSTIGSHWRVILLLLNKQRGVSQSIVLQKKLQNLPVLFPRTHSKNELVQLKSFKCPSENKQDGIIAWGEGDNTNIFLLERKQLKSFECASENN